VNPFQVVEDFESALCDYTGAKYAVTTTSCTMALLLACRWFAERQLIPNHTVTIPRYTYVGVPMSIMHAGFGVAFSDEEWLGEYRLDPLPVVDSARWFESDMFADARTAKFQCVSFHHTKTLAISTHGGAILHDNDEADEWFRMMRFDGRQQGVAPRDQKHWVHGYHAYMNPATAAEGLQRLCVLPKHNDPLPNDDYVDLSTLEIFK